MTSPVSPDPFATLSGPARLDLFTQRLATAGGQAVAIEGGVEALAAAIAERNPAGNTVVWIAQETTERAPDLLAALIALGLEPRVSSGPAEVRDQPLGLTIARATIAETGSSLLVEPTVEGRSVTLMTDTLIVLADPAMLVPSLMEAAPILREVSANGASYATFVTGPSRTADIERTLAVGVQGPGIFHVLFTSDIR
ncbi:MAG: LUD domain-containing protein [Thermomicrobiales bacterium]